MKILHTSDWHIGQTLYGFDRTPEHRHALAQIAGIAACQRPDVMIVSGDIFHTSNPSAAAQVILDEALADICSRCPDMPVVIIAGNHDGASRLEAFSTLMRRNNVYVSGQPPRVDDIDRRLAEIAIHLPAGHILPLPFMLPQRYDDTLRTALERFAASLTNSLPLVVTGHLTAAGGNFTGHTDASELTVGGLETVAPDKACIHLADYTALGHIHKPQTLRTAAGCARYSGSPLAVSFDEQFEHTVTIAEIGARGQKPQLSETAIEPLAPLLTLGPADGLGWKETLSALKKLKKNPPPAGAYFRLNVRVDADADRLPPDADSQAARLLDEAGARFCLINGIRKPTDTDSSSQQSMSMQEFRSISPLEIAGLYAARIGRTLTDSQRCLFAQAAADAQSTLHHDETH